MGYIGGKAEINSSRYKADCGKYEKSKLNKDF